MTVTTTSDLPSYQHPVYAIVTGQAISGVNVIARTTARPPVLRRGVHDVDDGLAVQAGSSIDAHVPDRHDLPDGFSGTIRRAGTPSAAARARRTSPVRR